MSPATQMLITLGAVLFGIGVCFLLGWLSGAMWGMRRWRRDFHRICSDYADKLYEIGELRRQIAILRPGNCYRVDAETETDS